MKNLIAAVLLLVCGSVQAATITIDFSDPNLPEQGLEEGFTTQGFSFTLFPVPIPVSPAYFIVGEQFIFCPGCNAAMENANGEVFSFYSFDAEAASFPQPDDLNIAVTGFLAGGGTLVETFPLSSGSFQHYELNWDGLIRVVFDPSISASIGYHFPTVIDNVVVSAVPIPAAVWLFGSGLGLLGWLRRRVS